MSRLLAVRRAVSEKALLYCRRCGHEWMPRMRDVRICPKCKTARWDQARKTDRRIEKTLKSAVSNAEQGALRDNEAFDVDALYVSKAMVDMGQPLKRFTAAAQGRATPIRKRTSHVTIHVATKGSN